MKESNNWCDKCYDEIKKMWDRKIDKQWNRK